MLPRGSSLRVSCIKVNAVAPFFSHNVDNPAVQYKYHTQPKENADGVLVFCVCRQPYSSDQFMIACDRCDEWVSDRRAVRALMSAMSSLCTTAKVQGRHRQLKSLQYSMCQCVKGPRSLHFRGSFSSQRSAAEILCVQVCGASSRVSCSAVCQRCSISPLREGFFSPKIGSRSTLCASRRSQLKSLL